MRKSNSFFLLYLGLDNAIDLKGLKRGFYHTSRDMSFADEGWLYISVPTDIDKSLSPKDKQIITVVASIKERFDEIEDWNIFKEEKKKLTIGYLETLIPNIQNYVDVMETGTPKTLERYTLNSKGAAYGWAVTVDQTLPHRMQHETPFKNLFLAGHWTNPGPGICAVVSSGWRVANMILNN